MADGAAALREFVRLLQPGGMQRLLGAIPPAAQRGTLCLAHPGPRPTAWGALLSTDRLSASACRDGIASSWLHAAGRREIS